MAAVTLITSGTYGSPGTHTQTPVDVSASSTLRLNLTASGWTGSTASKPCSIIVETGAKVPGTSPAVGEANGAMQPSWREIHRWDFQQRPGELLVDRVVLNDLDLFVRARVVIDGYAEAPNRTITQPYYTLELVGDAQGEAP